MKQAKISEINASDKSVTQLCRSGSPDNSSQIELKVLEALRWYIKEEKGKISDKNNYEMMNPVTYL